MGRTQWLLAGKIGGALVLAALAIWAVWSISAYQTRSVLLSEQHAERAERSTEDIESACAGVAGPPLADCVTRQIEFDDLDAQIRAANAAENQILPSWVAAVLSFAGTCLLVWTILETRAGLRVARQHMTTDLRAWVVMDRPINSEASNAHVDSVQHSHVRGFALSFVNAGRTPAVAVMANVRLTVVPWGQEDPPDMPPLGFVPDNPKSVVGPGKTFSSRTSVIVGADLNSWLTRRSAITLEFVVHYRTIFDDRLRVTTGTMYIVSNGVVMGPNGPELNIQYAPVGDWLAT